jgi:hypothetical protein
MPHQEDKVRWLQPMSPLQDGQRDLLCKVSGQAAQANHLIQSCLHMHRTSHRFRRRNYPPGYTEMLERQHGQLVSCVQELYQRARRGGSWNEPLPAVSNPYPSVHDILAALDLLEPKDDGSRDLETFNELVGSSQSDNDTPDSGLDIGTDGQDHHGSNPDQSTSPCEDATPFFPGTPTLEPTSTISSRPPTSSDQSMELSPEHPEQTTTARPTISRTYSQTLAEYTSSQARLFATLSTAPLNNRNFYNTANLPVQYGSTSTTSTTPSLSLDPQVMQQDYAPYDQRSMTASSDTLPFCHDWTRSGITTDDSDCSTDFRRLSQLDKSMGGVEGAGLVPGIM